MNFYKSLDHIRKMYRSGAKVAITEDGDFYWLIDGYTAHRIPKKETELNPALFQPFEINILRGMVKEAESGVQLKDTGLSQKSKTSTKLLVPFVSEDQDNRFTIWFQKMLLDLFPSESTLYGTGPLKPAAVKVYEETIGILLPCRNLTDIDIYDFMKGGRADA